jgi:hypothetical protein
VIHDRVYLLLDSALSMITVLRTSEDMGQWYIFRSYCFLRMGSEQMVRFLCIGDSMTVRGEGFPRQSGIFYSERLFAKLFRKPEVRVDYIWEAGISDMKDR